MKVFISSVRRGLESERDYLPDLLRAIGHDPSRFEDFGARNATSRGACLDGVNQAEAYVLLLGPHYGDEMDDSGISATEEEFNVAQQRGIPILVFKKTGISHDPAQHRFIERLGDYQHGRFWATFEDDKTLGLAVAKALRGLAVPAPPVTYLPLAAPATVRWRTQRPQLADNILRAPVLEVHVLPTGSGPLLPVSELREVADSLAASGRDRGFFSQGNALDINHDSESAWVVRATEPRISRTIFGERQPEPQPYAGMAISRDGSAMSFQALPTDNLGTLVNQHDLSKRITVLLRTLGSRLPDTEHVALAAGLEPIEMVAEGDPTEVGSRTTGSIAHSRGNAARAEPVDQILRASLIDGLPAVADELAVRILQALRAAQSQLRW
jgi:hypothetical protein